MRTLLLLLAILTAFCTLALSLAGAVSIEADVFNMAWPAPLGAGLASLCVLILMKTPRLRLARTAGLVAAGLIVLTATPWRMLAPHPSEAMSGGAPVMLTVTTFNAWASNTDPAAAAALLIDGGGDILALQEVGLAARNLPDLLSDTHPYRIRCRWAVELVSRIPFEASGCLDERALPAAWARVEIDGAAITVISVHLARPLAADFYRAHAAALSDHVAAHGSAPLVIAGDFNTAEGGFSMGRLERALAPARRVTYGHRTWPSKRLAPAPLLGIDHVWLSRGLCPAGGHVGPHAGSDHRPVTVQVSACPEDEG